MRRRSLIRLRSPPRWPETDASTPAPTGVPAKKSRRSHTGTSMTTVAPHLAEAIMRAGTQLTWTASAAVQRTPIHAASGLALVVLAAALLALAAIARVTRRLATLLSDLLQVTAAVASALFAIAILTGLVAVVILYGRASCRERV